MANDPSHGQPGVQLGPYTVVEELGRRGMGVVYRAKREDLGREFALKVILSGVDAAPEAVKRFEREATNARRASAP